MADGLSDIIKRYVVLGRPNNSGWHGIKCAVCNDYKVRAAFKFESDSVFYNCFNCGTKALYDAEDRKISDRMKAILIAFGVPESDIQKCVSLTFFNEKKTAAPIESKPHLELPTKAVALPPLSYLISTDSSPWCEVAREYLSGRGISPIDFPFYVSDHEKWSGRVIIPYIFREKIVYWQARSMDQSIVPRYKNPTVEKENLFFNMDEVYRYTDEPLIVSEGPLDARSIGKNGIAMLGSTLSEFRERELKKAAQRRKVIFLIDKNSNGYKLGQIVLKHESLEWYITCFPDNVDDANHALQLYGRLWLINYVTTTAVKGFAGKTVLEVRCEK